jgi:hypothetical protein
VKIRRLAAAGIVLLVPAALVLGGCGSSSKGSTTGGGTKAGAAASPSPSPLAPKDALAASVKQLTATTYDMNITSQEMTGNGSADPAGKKAAISASGTVEGMKIKMDIVAIGTDSWVKLDFGTELNQQLQIKSTNWYHLDLAKLGSKSSMPLDPSTGDSLDMAGVMAGIVTAERVDAQHYRGTMDLTSMTGVAAPGADELKKAGDKAKSVPFTATVDAQGRLTELKVDASSIDPTLSMTVTFSNYGSATPVQKPAGTIVEAPQSVYDMYKEQ